MTDNDYPPMADSSNIAKDWMDALLQDCGERRMKRIAKDFGLTGYSHMKKEELFRFLFNHMQTVQNCLTCQDNCDPNEHMFKATELPPEGAIISPGGTRSTRANPRASPASLVAQQDASKDKPVNDQTSESDNPLYTGQPSGSGGASPHIDASPRIPLADKVSQGGRSFQPNQDILKELAATQRRVQETLDDAEKAEDERRRKELEELEDDSDHSDEEQPDIDELLADQTKKQEADALRKHKAKDKEHAKKVQAAKDAKAARAAQKKKPKKTPAPISLKVPRGPVGQNKGPTTKKKAPPKTPGKKSPRFTIDIDEVEIPESDDEEEEGDDDAFSGST